jgi:peptide/nickel transport system permease protein
MLLFVLRRLILLLLTLAFASLVVFGVLEVLPGDAAQTMLGASATPEAVAALSRKLGLDQRCAAISASPTPMTRRSAL